MKADIDHIDRSEVHFALDCETEAEKSVLLCLFNPENIGDGCYIGRYDAHIIVDYNRLVGNGKTHCQITIQAKRKEVKPCKQ